MNATIPFPGTPRLVILPKGVDCVMSPGITTLDYGDILPHHAAGKILACSCNFG
jgi:hypothetical protein